MPSPDFETQEAGALWGLYYALYYAPNPVELFAQFPESVVLAYMQVSAVARGHDGDTTR